MGDALKIAIKSALITAIVVAAVVLLTTVQIPQIDYEAFSQGIGHAKALVNYFGSTTNQTLFNIGLALLGLRYVVYPTLCVFTMAMRWIMKVNE